MDPAEKSLLQQVVAMWKATGSTDQELLSAMMKAAGLLKRAAAFAEAEVLLAQGVPSVNVEAEFRPTPVHRFVPSNASNNKPPSTD